MRVRQLLPPRNERNSRIVPTALEEPQENRSAFLQQPPAEHDWIWDVQTRQRRQREARRESGDERIVQVQ
ncbi:hypothetical protein [Bradyrhizobium sp. BWA-3-5]|uniref:hypothetical protein n=1 Tax=Bradyrhizobium sp. BWA-3-5 TaxID=3080013 RepID=UPI00293EB68D|nr:hypothetical protein [Bradyrhizobium sp. BWA-3-5]WOH63660.1 hypothetical protein RX331_23425 [Bradyrhizobium sp. BWA-3-5]